MPVVLPTTAEWLETDGLGGFASGTVGGRRTRRYHALLLTALSPPTERMVLVHACEARLETDAGIFALDTQRYAPDVIHQNGERRLTGFESEPWPKWTFRLEDGTRVEQELFVPHGAAAVVLRWRLLYAAGPAVLTVRPFLSGRDYHALHRENPVFRFDAEVSGERVVWRPYDGVPGTIALANGEYRHEPLWYRQFLYEQERARGLDCTEDLAAPGSFRFDLVRGEAVLILQADHPAAGSIDPHAPAVALWHRLRQTELERRSAFASRLHRSAAAYLVRRGNGKTLLAGYPWFTDWGRDTFIALRGLCLATHRLDDAAAILLDWSGAVSEGMLPNRFPDRGDVLEYNSADASLWFVIAVHDFLETAAATGTFVSDETYDRLRQAVETILDGHIAGTRFGIRLADDGLLAAGVPGLQLTWMDAKAGDWVVTPRIGKPVEIAALWLNALRIGERFSQRRAGLFERGLATFRDRFRNVAEGCLYDVVDPDHRPGTVDATFRPNQILAVGGLPFPLLENEDARRVVDAVEARLWTPLGLRTLAADHPEYAPRYLGGVLERDGAYHQGTVWPWLIGPFAEAWVRVRGGTPAAVRAACERFLDPLLRHLDAAGLGHISEIADGNPPHTPRGCPFQAWSLGEVLRLSAGALREFE